MRLGKETMTSVKAVSAVKPLTLFSSFSEVSKSGLFYIFIFTNFVSLIVYFSPSGFSNLWELFRAGSYKRPWDFPVNFYLFYKFITIIVSIIKETNY